MSKTNVRETGDNGQPRIETEQPVDRITQQAAPDPFDPASLRLPQDFNTAIGVKKVLTTVVVGKPNRHQFVRVRPGEEWRLVTAVFVDKVNRESYLVLPNMWAELGGEISKVCLFSAVTSQGDFFLWQVNLPTTDGRPNRWNDSAIAAAQLAETKWVRMAANMSAGLYDVFEASGELGEPKWPDRSFRDIIELAFGKQRISDHDHPILRALRGEV